MHSVCIEPMLNRSQMKTNSRLVSYSKWSPNARVVINAETTFYDHCIERHISLRSPQFGTFDLFEVKCNQDGWSALNTF